VALLGSRLLSQPTHYDLQFLALPELVRTELPLTAVDVIGVHPLQPVSPLGISGLAKFRGIESGVSCNSEYAVDLTLQPEPPYIHSPARSQTFCMFSYPLTTPRFML